jgi:CheY-like chemotaxis protein
MGKAFSVLIAEDDEGHATLVRRHLRRSDAEITAVHLRDGQELLDYVYMREPWTTRRPHEALVIVVDLNMPRLGGLEVLRRLKADRAVSSIPVFVLTTTDNDVEIDRCYSLGAAVCLVKPVDYGAFASTIQRLGDLLITAYLPAEAHQGRIADGQ